jgi:hypothetical protein
MKGKTMNRIRMFAAALILCGLCTGLTVVGQDKTEKKSPNVQDTPKNLTINPKTKALQDLALAAKLITFGREHKSAESLLLAAKIIHTTPTAKLKADKSEVSGDAVKAQAAKQRDSSPKALIAEAKVMSSAPHIAALVAATEKIVDEESRGVVGGPQRGVQNVGPGQVWTVSGLTFAGGQLAVVDVQLLIAGRFILTVHDQSGNLVARDAVPGSFYNCRWVPISTGPVTVRLTNIDNITFTCDLLTN